MAPTAPQQRTVGGRRRLRTVLAVVLGTLVVAVVTVPVLVTLALRPTDGDRLARQLADRVALGIADDVATRGRSVDAERLAQEAVTDPRLPDDVPDAAYDVAPLTWSGRTDVPDGARVELSVAVDVPGASSQEVFGKSRSAGHTQACWRLVVRTDQDVADRERTTCPDGTPTATPSPSPLPTFPASAAADVRRALDALPGTASVADAERALTTRFPAPLSVRVERADDELVAAVGLASTRDCVVGVRADGGRARTVAGFDRVQLEPGEVGCSPSLYLAPVTTH